MVRLISATPIETIDKFGNPAGGDLRDSQGNLVPGFMPPTGPSTQALVDYINPQTGQRVTAPSGGYTPAPGFVLASEAQRNVNQPSVQNNTNGNNMAVQSTTQTSSIDPALLPYLTQGLERAQSLFLTGQQPTFFPGQTYVSPSAATTESIAQQEALARQASPVLQQGQQAFQAALGQQGQTAAGAFLNANPYQAQMIQAATRPLEQQFSQAVLPGISSLYSKSGRLGSGSMERALGTATEGFGRALGDVTSNIAGTQYQAERGLQQQAQLAQAALAQAAPSIYGQQFLPSQTLGQVGAQQEAIAAQPLQEQMARFQFGQQLPYQQLQGYLSSVYGSPMGSYGTQTTQTPMTTNRTTGALSGALAGGLAGYGLNQAFNFGSPYLSTGAGAAIGGLLGGFL
jgi:hypothetical protein